MYSAGKDSRKRMAKSSAPFSKRGTLYHRKHPLCQIRPGTGACGETEFAADRTFGYRSSNLADYVEEKTKGAYPAGEVICIGLDDLRHGRVDKVAGQLMEVRNFNKVIVNAVDYGDLKVFALALYEAMEQGKRFLFRTAASW